MVVYYETEISNNPHCPHGPMLLFGRIGKNDECKKFYSCSAYRNKKQCPFFLLKDDTHNFSKLRYKKEKKALLQTFEHYKSIRLQCKNGLVKYFCYTCNLLVCNAENEHDDHNVVEINNSLFANPLNLLSVKSSTKGESQYHFTEETTKVITSILLSIKATAVLCIGCPSLHQLILNDASLSTKLTSCLLDIDHRYFQFYDENKFQWFNMFNCHMFYNDGWKILKNLFATGKTVVVVDPPFGGHIEPLAYTFKRLSDVAEMSNSSEELTFILISPYFMERIIKKNLSGINMLDFKVEYINHRKFKSREQGGSKRGSPIRIFANINPSCIRLPEDCYKFCVPCDKWVSYENKHCDKCGTCTSKNGGVYVHCDICKICVKITWKHCHRCKRCTLLDHECRSTGLKAHRNKHDNKKQKVKIVRNNRRKMKKLNNKN